MLNQKLKTVKQVIMGQNIKGMTSGSWVEI
jgi:hypothetical protein